jgi:hypothetical protein
MDHDTLGSVSKAAALLVTVLLTACASNPKTRVDCEGRMTYYLKVVIDENGAPTGVVHKDSGADASELTVCPSDKVQWSARQKFWIWFYDNKSPSNQTMFESRRRNTIASPIRGDAAPGNYGYGVATNCQTGSCKVLDPMIIVRN